MKIVQVDTDEPRGPDRLIAENIPYGRYASEMASALNQTKGAWGKKFIVVSDGYQIYTDAEDMTDGSESPAAV